LDCPTFPADMSGINITCLEVIDEDAARQTVACVRTSALPDMSEGHIHPAFCFWTGQTELPLDYFEHLQEVFEDMEFARSDGLGPSKATCVGCYEYSELHPDSSPYGLDFGDYRSRVMFTSKIASALQTSFADLVPSARKLRSYVVVFIFENSVKFSYSKFTKRISNFRYQRYGADPTTILRPVGLPDPEQETAFVSDMRNLSTRELTIMALKFFHSSLSDVLDLQKRQSRKEYFALFQEECELKRALQVAEQECNSSWRRAVQVMHAENVSEPGLAAVAPELLNNLLESRTEMEELRTKLCRLGKAKRRWTEQDAQRNRAKRPSILDGTSQAIP